MTRSARNRPPTAADILLHVTPRTLSSVRRSAVLTTAVGLFLLVAGPASAEVPEGWSDPAPVPQLQALLIFVGVPLLMILMIAAAVYLPAMARGERVSPVASPGQDQWFGGPRGGAREIESADRGEQARDSQTGGAGGRW